MKKMNKMAPNHERNMLIQTHQLDKQQLIDLDELCDMCQKYDGNAVALYRHLLSQNRGRPSSILYYQDTLLVGFLGAFFFHTNACEIALMVSPKYRRQGIASRMLDVILPLIRSEGINTVIFSSPPELNDLWFWASGLQKQGREYRMQRVSQESISLVMPHQVFIRLATPADIPVLCTIGEACFPSEEDDRLTRFTSVLYDPHHTVFLITQHGMPVGKAHILWQENSARFSDIAILPTVQRQGLGGFLLSYCINHALLKGKTDLRLDVESHNQQALGLYTQLGFQINNAHDYWTIEEFGLTAFLKPL
jgi:ribosomal protein S18 acetylase RimI-like enzyme